MTVTPADTIHWLEASDGEELPYRHFPADPAGRRGSLVYLHGIQSHSAAAASSKRTSSPTASSVTSAPTASTTPASSMPAISRFGLRRPVRGDYHPSVTLWARIREYVRRLVVRSTSMHD